MKNRIIIFSLLILAGTSLSSCFLQKTDKFAPNTQSAGTIQFQVPDAALTGLSTTPPGIPQPSWDIVGARYSKAGVGAGAPNLIGGNVVVTANLSANMTNLTINMYISTSANPFAATGSNIRETKATFTGISGGSVTWTQSIATLTYNGVVVSPAAGTATGGGTTYILEFVASNSDGSQTTTRVFAAVLMQ